MYPTVPPAVTTDGGQTRRLDELEKQLAELRSELERLSTQMSHEATPVPSSARTTIVAPPTEPARHVGGFNPREHLDRYVASFDGGGEGSEYFRLAVDTYAPELLGPIADLVRNGSANATLREKLAQMLGTKRFAGNGLAIDSLLAVLQGIHDESLAITAVTGLQVVGTAETAIMLERVVWGIKSLSAQANALVAVARLSGSDANSALQRLYLSTNDPDQRGQVLSTLSPTDPDSALDVFRQASTDADAVRLFAAQAIQRFRGDAFMTFTDQWLDYERNERVRTMLGQAKGRMSEIPSYSPHKAIGPPDADPNRDHPNAWAYSSPEMGRQWIELSYQPPRRANALRIHEVNVPGEIIQVHLIDEAGGSRVIWSGDDPTTQPGVFELRFNPTSYRVQRVRIVLDSDKKQGWGEIDAVQMLGPDGSAWAASARASSSYGQQR